MTILAVLPHGASGWLDEVIAFGLPLIVLVVLYLWSSRKSKAGRK